MITQIPFPRKKTAQRKGEADDPLAKRHIGKHFICQQGCGLGHPAGATARAESALFAGKGNEALEMAVVTAHPQETVFETAALNSVLLINCGIDYTGDLQRAVYSG